MSYYKSLNYHHHHQKPWKKDKKKKRTGLSLEKIIRILKKDGCLTPDVGPKNRISKLLRKRSNYIRVDYVKGSREPTYIRVDKKTVEVRYRQKIEVTESFCIPPSTPQNPYGFIPHGWVPLNLKAVEELSEQFGYDFDQGGYLRGTKDGKKYTPPIINLKTRTIRGRCALTSLVCNSGIPIICIECDAYKNHISTQKESKKGDD